MSAVGQQIIDSFKRKVRNLSVFKAYSHISL